MSGQIKILNESNFKETIKSGISLVDFSAEWCGPCKMQKPIIEELATKLSEVNICQLDTDQNQAIAAEYNVMSLPTLMLFKDGKVIDQVVGLQSLDRLENLVKVAQ